MSGRISRRRFLTTFGTAIAVSSAGCSELTGEITQDNGLGRSIGKRDDNRPDEWMTLGQNPQNTKFNPGGAGPKEGPDIEWTYDVEYIFAPPVIRQDSIALSGIESLSVLDRDGTLRWQEAYQGVFDEVREYTTPVVITEEIICSSVRDNNSQFQLVGFTHSGDVSWNIDLGGSAGAATPFVTHQDGEIYASTASAPEGDGILRIDPSTGDVIQSMGFGAITYPIVTERFVLEISDERLRAYNKETSDVSWEFELLDGNIPRPVVGDDTVYVQYGNNTVGISLDDGSISLEATDSFGGRFAFVDDVVVEPAGDTLRAYDLQADEVLWDQEYPATLSPPAVADGVAYVGGEDKRIRGVEITTGEELWSRQLGDDVMRPVVAQGRVLAVSGDTLYSLA